MNKSYGINVATLADLPYPIIKRAKEVLAQLETSEHLNVRAHIDKPVQALDKVLIDELKAIDPNRLTPLQALDALVKIKQRMEQDE